jgi:hypothetical protein
VTEYDAAVAPTDLPVTAPLRALTRRRWASLGLRLVAMIGLLGVLTALTIAVVALVVILVITATAG